MEALAPLIAALHRWHAPVLALALALAAALAARALRRPGLAAVAAAIGILGAWWYAFGVLTGSPRQVPERLPALMLALVLIVPAGVLAARRWRQAAWPAAAVAALWAGWWMSGAARWLPDLIRAAPVFAGIAAGTLLLAARGVPRWAMPAAALALLAGFAAAPLPGPALPLALMLAAATLGAAIVPPRAAPPPPLGAVAVAAAVASLAALPVVLRGGAADWVAAAAPFAALWLGAPLGARVSRGFGAPAGAALVAAACAAVAHVLR